MQISEVKEFGRLSQPREVEIISSDATVIARTIVGDFDNNVYLIASGGNGLLIDAADDAEHILELARTLRVKITDVLTTHQHADHVQALEKVLAATGATHHVPRLDKPGIPAPGDEVYGNDAGTPEILRLTGNCSEMGMTAVELRGHTPGGLAVLLELPEDAPRAFVGDSIFPGGVGKTETPEQFTQLLNDVTERIFSLPDGTRIHPGHGDSTTVGTESPHVEDWCKRGW